MKSPVFLAIFQWMGWWTYWEFAGTGVTAQQDDDSFHYRILTQAKCWFHMISRQKLSMLGGTVPLVTWIRFEATPVDCYQMHLPGHVSVMIWAAVPDTSDTVPWAAVTLIDSVDPGSCCRSILRDTAQIDSFAGRTLNADSATLLRHLEQAEKRPRAWCCIGAGLRQGIELEACQGCTLARGEPHPGTQRWT